MTTENQNLAPPVAIQQKMPSVGSLPTSPIPKNQITLELYRFFNETAKLTVFLIFVLYSFGFIIWHSYLATYGVSAIEFLQMEYLSAAFCYLFLAISFSIPPALLFERLLLRLQKAENIESEKVSFLIFLWYLICTRLVGMFFPDPQPSHIPDKYFNYGFIVMILYAILIFSCKKKWEGSVWFKIIRSVDVVSVFLIGYIVIFLFLNHEVSKKFLLFSLVLYLAAIFAVGKDVRQVWKNADLLLKVLILGFLSLILISHIQIFGSSQFGKIPKQVGGGMPEKAFITISEKHQDLASFLNITDPIALATNGVMGPIQIIFRSDKELIFVAYKDPAVVESQTNIITVAKTNVTTITVRSKPQTDSQGIAKQIRSDLVDGIIFIK
jgi:hypothetical protein